MGAHEFRNHFGYFMELANAGAEIHVTRRDKPYVRLVPAQQPRLILVAEGAAGNGAISSSGDADS